MYLERIKGCVLICESIIVVKIKFCYVFNLFEYICWFFFKVYWLLSYI